MVGHEGSQIYILFPKSPTNVEEQLTGAWKSEIEKKRFCDLPVSGIRENVKLF